MRAGKWEREPRPSVTYSAGDHKHHGEMRVKRIDRSEKCVSFESESKVNDA